MIKPAPPKSTGIAWLLLLFCVVAGAIGLAFDLFSSGARPFGLVTQAGGRAALGIGVAAAILIIAHAMRLVLGRRVQGDEQKRGGSGAGDHV